MNFDSFEHIFLICEGASEIAIMNILLENNHLVLTYNDLVGFEPLHIRRAKDLENNYLQHSMNNIAIIRVMDSKNKNNLEFKLSKAYVNRVKVINLITAPEIEILMIIAMGKYEAYKNKGKVKPSIYVKEVLKIANPKSTLTINKFFEDSETLCNAIVKYNRYTRKVKNADTLYSLLKQKN